MTPKPNTNPSARIRRGALVFFLALLMAPPLLPGTTVTAFESEPPTPDLCDDEQDGDKFKLIKTETPTMAAVLLLQPKIDLQSIDDAAAFGLYQEPQPASVVGTVSYTYEIWDCVDYTGNNEAAIYVYKHSARFSANGIRMSENWDIPRELESSRHFYRCGPEIGTCAFIDRDDAIQYAKLMADIFPTYNSPEARFSIGNLGIEGSMAVNGHPTGVGSSLHFEGCAVEPLLCVAATAIVL